MVDQLLYKIPGKEIVHQFGEFKKNNLQNPAINGFIVSDFENKLQYLFEPNNKKSVSAFHTNNLIEKHWSKKEYENKASVFLKAVKTLGIKKAVLSRTKETSFSINNAKELFYYLSKKHPNAFVYLISSSNFGTWLGCTPELLIEIHKNTAFTMSLAGTKAVNDTAEWTEKEKNEQHFVTQFIVEEFSKMGIQNIEKHGPYPFNAGAVKHLRTDISFDIGKNKAIDIASIIHPSPAVSGLPQSFACELIKHAESHQRNLYTGFLGFISPSSTRLYVNLRCCQLYDKKAVLYLGGGFTKDSTPSNEWLETEEKSKTLMEAINAVNDYK